MSPHGDVVLAESLDHSTYMAMAHFLPASSFSLGASLGRQTTTRLLVG